VTRSHWLSIRDNGGSLQQFLRKRGVFVPLPSVRQGKGRNGAKAARRAIAKTWGAP
jgi:hypothetical protein